MAARVGLGLRLAIGTGRQLDADACDMLDHARPDLDQALSDGREPALRKWGRLGIAARTPCIGQKAAVWRTSRTYILSETQAT